MKHTLQITEDDGVVRVDKYLALKFPEYSRAAIAKLFDLNLIKRDKVALKAGEKLRPGAVIEYDLGPLQEVPDVIPLPILYEDENVIVINKLAGIISHARGRFWQEASVASFVRDKVSNASGDRAGIVHRLDRATSGVMICAKNETTIAFLQKQFHDRKVTKTYIAIIEKPPKEPKARIIAPIGRNIKNPKQFMVTPDGKPAETDYEVLETNNSLTMLKLTPKTGRTHQLRVHLSYIQRPIVGDELYSGKTNERLLLHAKSLEIMLPGGEKKEFIAPLPPEFKIPKVN
jgi:23S rRNA pseudouridine1911/1915/1917 synthase